MHYSGPTHKMIANASGMASAFPLCGPVRAMLGGLRRANANHAATVGARNQITLLTCKTRYPLIAGDTFYSQQSRGRICLVGSRYLGLIVISTEASGPRSLRSSA